MEWFISNWYIVLAHIAVIVCLVLVCYNFINWPTSEQLKKVREWLVYACLQAEKELGSGTGQMKLRMVYDMFLTKFTWLSKLITFEQFSALVDEALEEVRHLLESNNKVAAIVQDTQE